MYFYCYVYVFLLLCVLCSVYSVFHRANWHSSATLTDVFLCFSLSCKTNARLKLASMGQGPHSSQLV